MLNNKSFSFSLILIAIGLLISRCEYNKKNSNPDIRINIYSPYSCIYNLNILDGKIIVSSKRIELNFTDSTNIENDTIISQYERAFSQDLSYDLQNIVSEMAENRDTTPLLGNDVYRYEVFNRGELILNTTSSNQVYQAIYLVRPYIMPEKIMCCDFFQIFDSWQNENSK